MKQLNKTFWFSRKFNGIKKYCSKSISIMYCPQHWKFLKTTNNGAKKGRLEDTCYNTQLWILGLNICYTNWDFNR